MKAQILIIFSFLLSACQQQQDKADDFVPQHYEMKSSENFVVKNDVLWFNQKKYSGFLIELNANKDTILLETYVAGRLNGTCKKWYPNRQLQEVRQYKAGKKEGKQIAYWENGKKRFEFFAKNGEYEGELKEWSSNGKLFHLANYENGHEEGTQKMWYDNGKVRANYVIIKGRRFGLLGTKNCKNVSDSIFVVQ